MKGEMAGMVDGGGGGGTFARKMTGAGVQE